MMIVSIFDNRLYFRRMPIEHALQFRLDFYNVVVVHRWPTMMRRKVMIMEKSFSSRTQLKGIETRV